MSTLTGRAAEQAAADFLRTKGYKIVARNWRTRWCEIDIIATKANVVYFVEVKYRTTNTWGGGLDYITPRKLQQMHFAAEFWVAEQKFKGDYQLGAVEAEGVPPTITNWLDAL